jgi:hypothetical protein
MPSSLATRVFDGLSSLRLAVVVMVTLGTTCAYATFYERAHGTSAVQSDIYQTPGFALLLGLLGINIFAVMMKRYPWKAHHAGFVMAHIGIMILLAGSLISLHRGLDASLRLFEGETTDRVALLQKALFVTVPGGGPTAQFAARFEGLTPAPGRELRHPLPGSDIALVIEDYAPHVEVTATRLVRPAPPPAREERRRSAVKVRLEGPSARTASEWLPWSEVRRVPFASGSATIGYGAPQVALPFKVTLLAFKSEKYPGSRMPATFESVVRIDDPDRGVFERHITMNHPLHYRGYIFFQASFVEGTPNRSIFSVARAPGLPLVYLGSTLIGLGVAWMFYLKPYLARRQAGRALAADRERESRNDKTSADAVRGRSGPAQPASSGA